MFDYIIVGQGLCGTFLSWYLDQYNKTYIVIDEGKPSTASKVSSGIINPITGRRFVKTWIIDQILPFSHQAYTEINKELYKNSACHLELVEGSLSTIGMTRDSYIEQKNVIHFFSNKESQNIFYTRQQEDSQYLNLFPLPLRELERAFNYNYGYGEIDPCYLINTRILLNKYKEKLISENRLINEKFDFNNLKIDNYSVTYQHINASTIIFCDGALGANNPFFKNLPYALNKGELLLVNIPDLPRNYIFKKSNLTIVPWIGDLSSSIGTLANQHISTLKNVFWIGTSYEWNFYNDQPTKTFKEKTIAQLQEFLKLPFEVIDHQASIRSATLERRPFVGLHPTIPQIGILNGMGTKGCSLAPYFAYELAQHLCFGQEIMPEANVNRFKKVLERI